MKTVHFVPFMAFIFIISSCAPATLNRAERSGETKLDARTIFNLVSGNSMSLTAYDFVGTLYFGSDGRLAGVDNEKMYDTGRWDIQEQDLLCMRFRIWYYGDMKCYSLLKGDTSDSYSFFTPNGAAYYTGTLESGDIASLQKTFMAKPPPKMMRETFALEKEVFQKPEVAPASSVSPPKPTQAKSASTEATVRQLAKNCPGCNLSGAQLKEAVLSGALLEGANLANADLRYANLRRAKLANANLSGAQLNHANLPGADLSGCNLRNADLTGANLLLADFTGADLSGAILKNAYIENTKGIDK